MKKLFFVAVIIAILAAFFASAHPDGLDFVAEKFGFAEKGQGHQAPMPDYSLKFLPEGSVSTSLAGIAGILIVLAIFWLAAYILKKGEGYMKGNKKGLLVAFSLGFLLAVLFVSPVLAARPLVTDDFYTVAQGGYELEFGYSSTQNQASQANVFGLSFKRGFLPQFDFGIEVPYTSSSPAGLNDILLHAKYRFFNASENDGLTARIDYKFNNGELGQGLGSGDNDYGFLLIGSKMFGVTKTHFNIGYVLSGMNANIKEDDYIAYTLAAEYPLWGEKGDVVAEYVANNSLQPNPAFIQLGARYALSDGFKVDAGYACGLNDKSIKNSGTVGIHYEF